MTADVFVSYSRNDKDKVHALIEKMRQRGITVWVDQGGIDGAAMWTEEIVEAIEGCKVLMLMITQSSVSSHNVVKEVALSSERKKHILPVYLEQVELPKALKYPLAGIQHIEHFVDDQPHFEALIRSLSKLGVTLAQAASAGGAMPKLADADTGVKLLAVLPFDNISPERDSDYFSDGLTEELIANLSKLSEIKVVSRTTTMQYKETKKDTKTIAAELNVHYILEGSVRKIADNLRITAQLVEVATDAHIWAETYKGTMADVFDIQERVAKEIAEALKLKLTPTEKAVLTKRATIVPEAYDCWLRGKGFLKWVSSANLGFASQLFTRALELDPTYADAFAGLARTYVDTYRFFDRSEFLLENAMDNALRALMYDPSVSDAYAVLTSVYDCRGNKTDALVAAQRSIELDPDNASAHFALGTLHFNAGEYDKAAASFEKGIQLDPEAIANNGVLGMCYERLNLPEKARSHSEKLVALIPKYLSQHPDDSRAYMQLALELAKLGRSEEARKACMKALEISTNDAYMQYFATCLYSRLGDLELAVNTLRMAVQSGWNDHAWTKGDPDLDPIRNHPGYIELMKDK